MNSELTDILSIIGDTGPAAIIVAIYFTVGKRLEHLSRKIDIIVVLAAQAYRRAAETPPGVPAGINPQELPKDALDELVKRQP